MNEPPQTVGAPSELADAEEMPGCVVAFVKAVFFIPYFFFRELPTLPLDGLVLIYDRFGRWAAGVYVLTLISLGGLLCWGIINWIV